MLMLTLLATRGVAATRDGGDDVHMVRIMLVTVLIMRKSRL